MIFVHPDLLSSLDTECGKINSIIIEKPNYYYSFLNGLYCQTLGENGKASVFEKDKSLSLNKGIEILDSFFPFDLNKKTLLNKIASAMEKQAVSEIHYGDTMELLSKTEQYLDNLSFDFSCDIVFPKLSVSSIIKSASPELRDDYSSLPEKMLDYFELVYEFDHRKIFVTVNLRSFISDDEFDLFAQSVITHGVDIIMLENVERRKSKYEYRHIIDADLCQIDIK